MMRRRQRQIPAADLLAELTVSEGPLQAVSR